MASGSPNILQLGPVGAAFWTPFTSVTRQGFACNVSASLVLTHRGKKKRKTGGCLLKLARTKCRTVHSKNYYGCPWQNIMCTPCWFSEATIIQIFSLSVQSSKWYQFSFTMTSTYPSQLPFTHAGGLASEDDCQRKCFLHLKHASKAGTPNDFDFAKQYKAV